MTPDNAAREGLSTSSAAYGARAAEYTELLGTMDAVAEDDRLLVEAWADRVDGVLADVGCGPAHWTAHLASLGHDVTGIEPVEEFVTHAHRTHAEARVEPGSFQTLPVAAFNGILGWYSIIHTPPVEMTALLERAHQALRPGGSLLLGFFASDQVEAFEHAVTTAWYWPVDELAGVMTAAGFTVVGRGTRQDTGPAGTGGSRLSGTESSGALRPKFSKEPPFTSRVRSSTRLDSQPPRRKRSFAAEAILVTT